jgi:hypothetical protein
VITFIDGSGGGTMKTKQQENAGKSATQKKAEQKAAKAKKNEKKTIYD